MCHARRLNSSSMRILCRCSLLQYLFNVTATPPRSDRGFCFVPRYMNCWVNLPYIAGLWIQLQLWICACNLIGFMRICIKVHLDVCLYASKSGWIYAYVHKASQDLAGPKPGPGPRAARSQARSGTGPRPGPPALGPGPGSVRSWLALCTYA